MRLIDERGRVFGRLNAVDAFMCALLFVMLPVAYAAYALFRTPAAKLTGIEPHQASMGPQLRVRISGTHLRPFMRVSFDTTQGRTFLIGSTTSAEVEVPDLQPGTYDVVLYDYAQEVDRLPKAFTILPRTPAPSATFVAAGSFIGLSDATADAIQPSLTFPRNGRVIATVLANAPKRLADVAVRAGDTVLAVTIPGQFAVPAALQIECFLESNPDGSLRCTVYGAYQPALVAPDSVIQLPFRNTFVNFQVAEVHPPVDPTFVQVQVRTATDIGAGLRAGDTDSNMPAYPKAWIAAVESVNSRDVRLRLPVQHLRNGWSYRGQFVKLGGGLHFETASVVINGTITQLSPAPEMHK